ncbi:LOW QUALITY PROTEIN: hypothetical protein U9M48_009371 [Paspalum notatum var. saurae]|uniref:RNase H type-1 domain-containing protein n=1 Tax=Paspalum notatum var. saurae TaxID=547442 RepID=A0AAQ3SSA7_PASNO
MVDINTISDLSNSPEPLTAWRPPSKPFFKPLHRPFLGRSLLRLIPRKPPKPPPPPALPPLPPRPLQPGTPPERAGRQLPTEGRDYYVVRKGDMVAVYKSLSDCQAQICSSVSGPAASAYKGHSWSAGKEEYLSAQGLSNANYVINAAELREDILGPLVPCSYQEIMGSSSNQLAPNYLGFHNGMASQTGPQCVDLNHEARSGSSSHISLPNFRHSGAVDAQPISKQYMIGILHFDGASKGNPGKAGAGAVLMTEDGRVISRLREGLGVVTNNVAEYRGLILGLKYAIRHGFKRIKVHGDSQLVCNQTNYVEWAAVMRVRLQVRHMWEAVRYGDVDYYEDRRAPDALIAAVPPEMQFSLSKSGLPKRAGTPSLQHASAATVPARPHLRALRKEWENLAFKPGEDVDDFALRLNTLLQKLVQFGDDTYDEERAVQKLFRCIPEKYKQIARSIESLLDLSTMSIEEAIGTRRVRTARDVVFDEGRGWAWDKAVDDGSTPTYDDFTVEYIHFERGGSRRLLFTEHAYPGPRASTDSSVTLSSHDFGCTKFFTNTTAAGYPTHFSTDGMGFEQSPHEVAIYRRGNGGNAWPVGVYVDDLVITGVKDAEVAAFKEEMKATFRMSDTGPLSFYPGIEVHRDDSGITLRQTAYAKRVVELAGLTDRNPALTPMEERAKPSRDKARRRRWTLREYRRLVGSLRYLVHTRPDLAFSVGYSVHAATDDGAPAAVKRIIRYVAGTLDHGLYYPRCPGEAHLVGYGDGDHGGDIDTGKSTSGILFFLGKCLVNGVWQTKHQNMMELCNEVRRLKENFYSFEISHVRREWNAEADRQANIGITLTSGTVSEERGDL